MRLSEAIRLGAMLKPQTHGVFYRDGATCANGAALDAISALNTTIDEWSPERNIRLELEFPLVCAPAPLCPACHTRGGVIVEWLIAHLNDGHRWTREQIADYVATLEQAHATPETCAAVDPQVEVLERVTTRA